MPTQKAWAEAKAQNNFISQPSAQDSKVGESRQSYQTKGSVKTQSRAESASHYGQRQYKPAPPVKWYYVYLLKLDGGIYYPGYTDDLEARLEEHKNGISSSTRGKNPVLQCFEHLPDKSTAIAREKELQALAKANPRRIVQMVVRFQNLVRKLDCT